MKILTVFPWLEKFDRYVPQMKAIADRVEEFHIGYTSGVPRREWKKHFTFHKFIKYAYKPDIAGWRRGLHSFLRPQRALWLGFKSKREALRYFRNVDFDIVYVLSGYWAVEICQYLANKHHVPYVVRLRGNYQLELEMKHPWQTKWLYLSNALRSLKKADLVIPISKRLRKYALYWGVNPEKLSEPIRLGVDTKQFEHTLVTHNKTLTLGYAGRITQEKGAYRLVQLMKQLPEVNFLVAGTKQCEIDFPSNSQYLGQLPYEDMPKFYKSIDALVLPSHTEGFPCVILEAYACGKPVLATHEAFPSELKVYGKVGDIKAFPQYVREITNLDLEGIGKEARNYVENTYSWQKFGESITTQLASMRC